MRTTRRAALVIPALAAIGFATTAFAAPTKTELAGNPLTEYPFFEYVKAFNVNAPINIAIESDRVSRRASYERG